MTSNQPMENVSNIFVENWSPLDPAAPILHHLPFKIGHTGHAQVSKYLRIKEHTSKDDLPPYELAKAPITLGTSVKSAAFRGRYIKGTDVTLGDSYTGVVFREEEGDVITRVADLFDPKSEESEEYADLKGTTNIRPWAVQNRFKTYTYWTRSSKPSSNDKHVKWLDWLNKIAPAIHSAVDLQKPLKYALDKTAKPTPMATDGPTPTIDDDLPKRKGLKRNIPTEGTLEDIPVEPSESKKAKLVDDIIM